jgi:ABC-2 type transport system ATP-binding protein
VNKNAVSRAVDDDTLTPVIELHAITKSFRHFEALRDITVNFPVGVTGLLGPNGAGKSTLIKILLGLLRASSGTGKVLGRDTWRDSKAIRQLVGYLPEDDCYLPSLSGVESVQFAARLNCMPATESLRRAHEILDFCGAGQERYRTVDTYSTGMRQKLKFAQALVHDPQLLILDEPTSGLDPEERDAMLNRIRVLSREHGKSIIICTHILPDCQQVSDYVVILASGKVTVAKPMHELARPSVPALQIQTIGPADVLRDALQEMNFVTHLNPVGMLMVQSDSEACVRAIWRVASEKEIVIRSLTPAKNSMETIFLEAVQAAAGPTDHADL